MLESAKTGTFGFGLPEESESMLELRLIRREQKLLREQKYKKLQEKHSKVCMWCLTHSQSNGKLNHEKWCRNNGSL